MAALALLSCGSRELVFTAADNRATIPVGPTSTIVTTGAAGRSDDGGSSGGAGGSSGGAGGSFAGAGGSFAGAGGSFGGNGGTDAGAWNLDGGGSCDWPVPPAPQGCDFPLMPGRPVVPTRDLISDFDGGSGAFIQAVMPSGVWALDRDGTGTADMRIEPCGTTGNGLHFVGSGNTLWGADVAAAFISQTQPINAMRFNGIAFTMTSARPVPVILKLQNIDSQPPLCECDETKFECYGGYVIGGPSPTTPTAFRPQWDAFRPSTEGYHRPGQTCVSPMELISIAFAVGPGVDFDLCIDDIKFF